MLWTVPSHISTTTSCSIRSSMCGTFQLDFLFILFCSNSSLIVQDSLPILYKIIIIISDYFNILMYVLLQIMFKQYKKYFHCVKKLYFVLFSFKKINKKFSLWSYANLKQIKQC